MCLPPCVSQVAPSTSVSRSFGRLSASPPCRRSRTVAVGPSALVRARCDAVRRDIIFPLSRAFAHSPRCCSLLSLPAVLQSPLVSLRRRQPRKDASALRYFPLRDTCLGIACSRSRAPSRCSSGRRRSSVHRTPPCPAPRPLTQLQAKYLRTGVVTTAWVTPMFPLGGPPYYCNLVFLPSIARCHGADGVWESAGYTSGLLGQRGCFISGPALPWTSTHTIIGLLC